MSGLDPTAFVNSRRDEHSLGYQALRAYAQDLRNFTRFTRAHEFNDPLSKNYILAYRRHLRDKLIRQRQPTMGRSWSLSSSYVRQTDPTRAS